MSLVAFPISYVASGRVTGIIKQFPVLLKRKLLLDREYKLCSLRRPLHKILLPPYKILEFAINYIYYMEVIRSLQWINGYDFCKS